MNASTQIIELLVRPERSSELSFERSGIIAYRNWQTAQLGQHLTPFDLRQHLFPLLDEEGVVAGVVTGRLTHDSTLLRAKLEPLALFALRNDVIGAQLDEAIERRCQAYLARFAHANALAAVAQQENTSRLGALKTLRNVLGLEYQAIAAAYATDYATIPPDKQLVKPSVVTTTSGKTVSKSLLTGLATVQTKSLFSVKDPHGVELQMGHTGWWASVPATYEEKANGEAETAKYIPVDPQKPALAALTEVDYDDRCNPQLTQTALSQGEPYRHLPFENEIGYQRASAELSELIIEQTALTVAAGRVAESLASELRAANLLVRKLQLEFVQTYLFSSYAGDVIGIHKDEGEWVAAGQPVASIHDPQTILLVGRVKHRGVLGLGMKIQVANADAFDSTPPLPVSVSGQLVSIRTHDPENNVWEIIANVTSSAHPPVPINYHFPPDPSETQITITP